MSTLPRLSQTRRYYPTVLELECFLTAANQLVESDDYSFLAYFDDNGYYKGPDQHGIEPIFTDESIVISDMAVMLIAAGEKFAGNNPGEEADYWVEFGFTAETAWEWVQIGCWSSCVAREWRDAGLTPEIVAAAAEVLVESIPEGEDPCDTYTDGSPIYSCCNDDTDPEVIAMCCREVMREFGRLSLREWSHGLEHVMVFVSGVGYPTGNLQPYGHPDMTWLNEIGIDQLCGTTDEQGRWQWDGKGDARDERGNSITKITAYVSREQWEFGVNEYMEC